MTPYSPLSAAEKHRGSALTEAERTRKRRRREKEDLQHFNIDAPCAIIGRLIDTGYLAVEDAGDRRAGERALEELIADQFG